MLDKIRRAKDTVQKHRTKIAFGSGVLVGAGGILYWGHTINLARPQFPLTLAADSETLKRLIDNPDGAIQWTHSTGSVVNVVNEANSTLT